MCGAGGDPYRASPRRRNRQVPVPESEKVRLVLVIPVERCPLVLPPFLPDPLEPRLFERPRGHAKLAAQPRRVSARLVPDQLRNIGERQPLLVVEMEHEASQILPSSFVEALDAEPFRSCELQQSLLRIVELDLLRFVSQRLRSVKLHLSATKARESANRKKPSSCPREFEEDGF